MIKATKENAWNDSLEKNATKFNEIWNYLVYIYFDNIKSK